MPTFSNIELKADGKYYADKIWGTHDFTTNKGIKADASGYAASKRVTIKGKVKGLASGQDWICIRAGIRNHSVCELIE